MIRTRRQTPASPTYLRATAAFALGLLPFMAGCFAGTLDKAQIARGRLCFDEAPIRLSVEVAPTLLDQTGEAPQILGRVLALGSAGILRRSRIFHSVARPGVPLTEAPHRVVRLEGEIVEFSFFQDYRWLLLYGGIFIIPGGTALVIALFLFGGPVYTFRGRLTVELRLRDVESGVVLGRYRGTAGEHRHHSFYSFFGDLDPSFWDKPQWLFGLALREALTGVMEDRVTYRRLARGLPPGA